MAQVLTLSEIKDLDEQLIKGDCAVVNIDNQWRVDVNIERMGDADNLQISFIPKLTPDLLEKGELKAEAKLRVREGVIESLPKPEQVDQKIQDNLEARPLLPDAFIAGVLVPAHSNPIRKSDIKRWVEGNSDYTLINPDEAEQTTRRYGIEVPERGFPYVFKPIEASKTQHILVVGQDKNILTVVALGSVTSQPAIEHRRDFIDRFSLMARRDLDEKISRACSDTALSKILVNEQVSEILGEAFPDEHKSSPFLIRAESIVKYIYLDEMRKRIPSRFSQYIDKLIRSNFDKTEAPVDRPRVVADESISVIWKVESVPARNGSPADCELTIIPSRIFA